MCDSQASSVREITCSRRPLQALLPGDGNTSITSYPSFRQSSEFRNGSFSRHPLRGNDTYLFIILTTRMLPPIVVIIPIFLMFRLAGLSGTYLGIILLYTAFNLPFTIWMMKSFFDELSPEVEDAARMDGSSERRVFFKICLPQVGAGLAATAVFGLILTWNEFLFALLLTGVETRTVPVAMAQTIGGDIGVRWGLLAAIETLFLIPVIVVVFVLQHHLLRGVTFGTIRR
jgi:multiple sugar transport system permease protein